MADLSKRLQGGYSYEDVAQSIASVDDYLVWLKGERLTPEQKLAELRKTMDSSGHLSKRTFEELLMMRFCGLVPERTP